MKKEASPYADQYAPNGYHLWDTWFYKDRQGIVHAMSLLALKHHAPEERHHHALIGHATTKDIFSNKWQEQPPALRPGEAGEWDDRSLWTGSIIEKDGVHYMFYTGRSRMPEENFWVQSIGVATSTDMQTWTKPSDNPIIVPHGEFYDASTSLNQLGLPPAWRDPFVYFDESIDEYIMLVTARTTTDKPYNGCIALLKSKNKSMTDWEVGEPLLAPGLYDEMEVPQMVVREDGYYLLFSTDAKCYHPSLAKPRSGLHGYYAQSLYGPYEPINGNGSIPTSSEEIYSTRIVAETETPGIYAAMGWLNKDKNGEFIGKLSKPFALGMDRGTVRLAA